MNQFMTNPWLFAGTVIWVVGGIVSIVQKNEDGICTAVIASIVLGLGYVVMHRY